MDRRDFLRSATIVTAGLSFPGPARLFADESSSAGWRTFEVTTRVEILKPSGTTRVWLPVPLANKTIFQRTLGNKFSGEEDVHKLAVYSGKEFSHVRVEACDACNSYIKTVDLTKDGHAVPVVDELATIPLNLWAAEHGYLKLQNNFLGI
jgi:hypothetical protein